MTNEQREIMRLLARIETDARLIEDYHQRLGDALAECMRLKLRAEAAEQDSERFRWLRDLQCCSFSLSLNEEHAPNYMTADEWIDSSANDDFSDDDPTEVQRMRDTNTIWTLQVYPDTPVGFNVWHGSTIDATIDAARSTTTGEAG